MAQSGVNLSGVGVSLVPGGSSSITPGTTVITGGTDTRVLFDDAGFVGENAGLTFAKTTGLLSATLVAIGGATIGSDVLGITGSVRQTAGSAPFYIGTATTRAYTSVLVTGSNGWVVTSGAADVLAGDSTGLLLVSSGVQSWRSTTNLLTGTVDATLSRSAGGILQVGTTAANALGSLNLANLTMTGNFGGPDVASGAAAYNVTFAGNTGAATTGPLVTIKGSAGGSGASVGGELRLQGGTPTAGTGGAITFYTSATTTPTLALTISNAQLATFAGNIVKLGGAVLLTTSTALTDGAAAGVGTLTNAPASTNPTKWIGVNDNGTTRYIPAW